MGISPAVSCVGVEQIVQGSMKRTYSSDTRRRSKRHDYFIKLFGGWFTGLRVPEASDPLERPSERS